MTTDVAVDVPRERRPLPRERHLLAVATMNAIELLKAQHKKTKAALEKASEAKLDSRESKKAADELVAHMVIEEHVFYPRVRELMKDMVGESYEEHTVARFALARALLARGEEQIKARFTVLKELIEHHVEEEEEELFPKVEKALDDDKLARLGEEMATRFDEVAEAGFQKVIPKGVIITSADKSLKKKKTAPRVRKTQATRRKSAA
jgi:hemerythrin superfamily protein